MSQLLIIGNGFDKYCGLRSSFNDYHIHHINNNRTVRSFYDLLTKNNMTLLYLQNNHVELARELTVWDVLMLSKTSLDEETKWCDIEKSICASFLPKNKKSDSNTEGNLWNHVFDIENVNHVLSLDLADRLDTLENVLIMLSLYLHFGNRTNSLLCNQEDDPHCNEQCPEITDFITNPNQHYTFLLDQLIKYEQAFSKYLDNEIKNNPAYNDNKTRLFELFNNLGVKYVMSFNYTSYRPDRLDNAGVTVENVHGSLKKNNSIIGIDSTKISHQEPYFIFTKTYRKVQQFTKLQYKVVQDYLLDDCNELLFFGHSLNEQDYAYFQTLFDRFDLYTSRMKLKFYYHIYNNSKAEIISSSQVKAVIHLIETYGETLENRARGKNLLHKLLNENRLEIRLFSDIEKDVCLKHISMAIE